LLTFLSIQSALPNLHPAVIHFPIALALTALALRAVQIVKPGWRNLDVSTTILTGLAAMGGVAAWLAGKQAAAGLGAISLAAETQLSRHANLAGVTVLLLAAATVVSLLVGRWAKATASASRVPGVAGFAALIVAAGFLMATSDMGGALVYRYGVAVDSSAESGTEPGNAATASDPTVPTAVTPGDGTVVWSPNGTAGMVFQVNGSGIIALPGQFGDVGVSASVDPTGFTGELALVHHAQSVAEWEGFRLTTGNKVQLVQARGGKEVVLAKSSLLFPRETTSLRVTSAEGHYKGLMDGDMVVHGHGPSGPEGMVGLLYSGQGMLKVYSLSVEKAEDH